MRSILVLLVATGCATTGAPKPSLPIPASPQPAAPISDNGPWAFTYTSDTVRLQISRSAAIESLTDSATHREISTNNTHEVFALVANADTVRYTATVDSFSTASQGLINSAPPVSLPIQVTGVIDTVPAAADSAVGETCDPVQANLETDVRNVLISFPRQLASGQTWRDEIVRTACYGTIPVRATVIRRFSVTGKTSFNGQTGVSVERTDSISAHGQGRQLQHQLAIEASGIGTAMYIVSPSLGRLLHLTTTQNLEFAIRASGRTNRFRETAKEEFNRVP